MKTERLCKMNGDFEQTDWEDSQADSLPFNLLLVPIAPDAPVVTIHFRDGQSSFGEGRPPIPELGSRYCGLCTTEGVQIQSETGIELWRPNHLKELPGCCAWVVPRVSPLVGHLELLEGDKPVRNWPIYSQPYRVGRGGLNSRRNDIELPFPSVSRAHALIWIDEKERLWVRAESVNSPTEHSGRRLAPAEVAELSALSLLTLGRCVLRWQPVTEVKKQFSFYTLGRFQVVWGDKVWTDADFKTEKLRWLLCLIAWPWGRSLSVEQLIELLWPDVSVLQGRKNLSRLVQQLREPGFLGDELDLILMRTATTWQLNPKYLGTHDAAQLAALSERSSLEEIQQTLDSYLGPYLESCYEEWSVQRREQLELNALAGCRRLAAQCEKIGDWTALKKAAEIGLKLDPVCEEFCQQLLVSLRHLGCSQEAALVYHSFSRRFVDECGVQPQPSLREAAGVL